MPSNHILERTNRVNMLFDFYEKLLTDKQQTFLKLYYHDNFSLGEIADDFGISRQAVYEHIKRGQSILDDYEQKLRLLAKHEERSEWISRMSDRLKQLAPNDRLELGSMLDRLMAIDMSNEAQPSRESKDQDIP